jgi:hypothetical protein
MNDRSWLMGNLDGYIDHEINKIDGYTGKLYCLLSMMLSLGLYKVSHFYKIRITIFNDSN